MSDPATAAGSSEEEQVTGQQTVGDTRLDSIPGKQYADFEAWLKERGQLQPDEPQTPAVEPTETETEPPPEPTDTEKLQLEIKRLNEELKKRDDSRRAELLALFSKKDQKRYAEYSIEALEAIIEDREVTPRQRGIGRPASTSSGEQKTKEPGRLGTYDRKSRSWK
jgi:hypothetical protein